MAGGRPTKYNKEVQKIADDYVDSYEMYREVDGKMLPNSIPSQCELAFKLNVHRDTIANWGKENKQFFSTLERINQLQELFLSHHGLLRGYDSRLTQMFLTNLTSYREKMPDVEEGEISVTVKKNIKSNAN